MRRAMLAALALALGALTLTAACRPASRAGRSAESTPTPAFEITAPPTALPSAEVTSFKGQRLTPIDGLYENSIKGPQKIDRDAYRLEIKGLVNEPVSLTYDELIAMRPAFAKVVRLNCVEGWSVTFLWEGVRVEDLLERAGGAKGDGKVVIFRAHDGYSSALPLDYLLDRDILLAYRENGVQLDPKWGWPLHLVAEDKWGYKWVKWVESIEVSADEGYRGYWESRGYSNSGDLDKPEFGP